MNKDKLTARVRQTDVELEHTANYLADDDTELERNPHRNTGKLEAGLGNFREKIRKGPKQLGY